MSAGTTRRPRVHQVLATLGYGDAIGHEVLGIQRVLRRAGYESQIFVETADPRLEPLTIDYMEMVGAIAPEDVLIHHFSIGSRASRIAYAQPGRMALVYHNITPPEYFLGVHTELVKLCFWGRRELTAYIDRSDIALGDSEFNRQELESLGFRRTGVLPVVSDFSHLDVPPNHLVAGQFDDEWTNVMFVGRVIPNKRFDTVIRAFHVYRTRYNTRARLLLVGSYGGFERYQAMLQSLVTSLGTPDVHFLGQVSNEELTALYDVADAFLCASEHEGFCVPLIEAFYKRVPVLAYAATAVPATMDGGGVLYDTTEPFEIAGILDAVAGDSRLQDAVLASQDAALERLLARDFAGTLLGFVDGLLKGPARQAPVLPADSWPQLDRFEWLEEMRQFRPALFKALPESRTAARGPRPAASDSQP
jgi:L-malate glycosyltransferase